MSKTSIIQGKGPYKKLTLHYLYQLTNKYCSYCYFQLLPHFTDYGKIVWNKNLVIPMIYKNISTTNTEMHYYQ